MPQTFDLLLKGAYAVTPSGIVLADIGVVDGKIAAIGASSTSVARQVMNLHGLTVLPGLIDTQVHFREPGLEHKEDLATGTMGAALGGVTGIFEMPNTKPSATTAAAIADKVARAHGRAWVDYAFFLGAAADNVDHLGDWENEPGCAGVKVFMGSSTGSLLVSDDATLAKVLANGKRRVAVHCEDEDRLVARKHIAVEAAHPRAHPVWRDEQSALIATQRLVALAEAARRPVHVLHVTTAQEMEFLAHHKDWATVETTPQHLTLAAPECYERLGTLAQMNPPIRDATHRDALWKAVNDGIVDVLGSDHAPHTMDEKAKPYPESPSGMTGVQTIVPIMLDHVHNGHLSIQRLVDLMAYGPARIYNTRGKGRIAVGYDADFTIVDEKAERTIANHWIASRSGWTPFDGVKVTGWPHATVIRGHVVMREDELLAPPLGEPIRFLNV